MSPPNKHLPRRHIASLGLFVLIPFDSSAQVLSQPDLDYGPHSVGYSHRYVLDPTRMWEPFPENTEVEQGRRPIRVGIWYPASRSARGMPYGQYVTPAAPDAYSSLLNQVLARYDLWSDHGMFSDDSVAVTRLLELETRAQLDAEAAAGRFPVVLYSAGWGSRSPDNTKLAEYLASHGYAVVTVPQLGPGAVEFDFRVTGDRVDDQVMDLAYALDVVGRERFADTTRVAVMGFSIGGIAALWLAERDPRVDAVIGLDGSFLFEDWVDFAASPPMPEGPPRRIPLLGFYRGHPAQTDNVTHRLLDQLPHFESRTIRVERATHGEFSNEPSLFAALGIPWMRSNFNSLEQAVAAHNAVAVATLGFLEWALVSQERDLSPSALVSEPWDAQLSPDRWPSGGR